MTPSFSIERRQAAEVVSWIRDRIPEQKGNAREIGSQRKEKKFLPSPPRRRGRFPRVTYHGASPPMIFLLPPHRPSLSATLSARPSMAKITRARKMMSFMRAHPPPFRFPSLASSPIRTQISIDLKTPESMDQKNPVSLASVKSFLRGLWGFIKRRILLSFSLADPSTSYALGFGVCG